MSDWDEVTQTEPGEADGAVIEAPIRRTNAYLVVITGAGVGTMHRLPDHDAIIGRAQRAEIRLLDDGVSREHARIRADAGKVIIEDLGSRNGTFVNGRKLERTLTLFDGDKVQIGRTSVLRFSYHDSLDESFHEQMLQSALRDSATKLFNKRYFLDRLDGELKFALRHGSALSVLMVDLDLFKQVNDRFGHVAGDAVLANVAQIIARSVRNEDVVARFGGEEIGIILRATELEQAITLAERLRRLVEGAVTRSDDGQAIRVTISLGAAGIPSQSCDTVPELLNAADQALYRAKRQGRNQVAR
ncbi:MAG: GGDEF domain-containing protein [Kofleriaceae bacterium]